MLLEAPPAAWDDTSKVGRGSWRLQQAANRGGTARELDGIRRGRIDGWLQKYAIANPKGVRRETDAR